MSASEPGAMDEDNVLYGRCQSRCRGHAEDEKDGGRRRKSEERVSVDHIWFSRLFLLTRCFIPPLYQGGTISNCCINVRLSSMCQLSVMRPSSNRKMSVAMKSMG
jgi:hypothetical protein